LEEDPANLASRDLDLSIVAAPEHATLCIPAFLFCFDHW